MNVNAIFSASACLIMADQLQNQVDDLRRRACDLKLKRGLAKTGRDDLSAFARAAIYLKSLPDYHLSTATLWREISARFFIDPDKFGDYARRICANKRREITNHKIRGVLIALDKGQKQNHIARRFDLSPARICQIKRDGRDQLAANASGVSLKFYRSRMKKPASSAG